MAFQLPRLSLVNPIVDGSGKPTNILQRWWQSICETIEGQENNQDTLISQLQASLTLAGQAQAASDASTGAAKSGQATTTGLNITLSTFIHGPTVALTGVTAGMPHLTLTGSGPQSAVSNGGPMDGEYRVVEVVGASETTIFTDTFSVRTLNNGSTVVILGSPANTQVFTRSAIGAVSYRLDVRKTAGAGEADSLSAYLFARRAP